MPVRPQSDSDPDASISFNWRLNSHRHTMSLEVPYMMSNRNTFNMERLQMIPNFNIFCFECNGAGHVWCLPYLLASNFS